MPERTIVDQMESVIEEVSTGLAESTVAIMRALIPDGRGFGQKLQHPNDQVLYYLQNLRGNPDAWDKWIQDRVKQIEERLLAAGVPEEDVGKATPFNRVQAEALEYSSRMERMMQRGAEERAEKRKSEQEAVLSYDSL